MKNILFISLVLFASLIKGQDSAYCYNSGLAVIPAEDASFPVIKNQHQSLILMSNVMRQKEVLGFLQGKNNSSLEKLLAKIKLSKNLRFVGFAAFPAGIMGAITISNANKNHSSKGAGIGLISLSAVSLSSGFYFNRQRKENYKKAIAKYNQLYN